MPIYCYVVEETGETFERTFPMKSVREAITVHCADGKIRRAHRDYAAEHKIGDKSANWPITSIALGVKPNQVDAERKRLSNQGINVDFTPEGWMRIPDRSTHKRVLRHFGKELGVVDRDAYN